MKKYLELRKIGNFYHAFDDDALILWYLFKYQYKNKKVGFPIKTLDKVKNKLEELHIYYVIHNEKEIIYKQGYNEYNEVLKKANDYYLSQEKKEAILNNLEHLSKTKLNKIVKYIEDVLNE